MKLKNKITTIILTSLLIFSCSDYLETSPKDFATPNAYIESEATAEIMLNGVYKKLDYFETDASYAKVQSFYLDVMSDNAFNRSPWEGATDFARGTVTAEATRVAWKWDRNYLGIARANSFLDAMESPNFTSDNIPRYTAEAKFLRAWYYADLINFFGNVPLIIVTADLENGQPENTPKAETVAQIIKDLNEAIPELPLKYSDAKNIGRITKGAALALKSRVLLYNEMWAEAADAAKECMDLGVYSLFPDYEGLFLEENESAVTNSEAILEVFYTPQTNPSFFQMPLMEWWPSYLPTLQLAESYYMANGLPITDPSSGYDPDNPYMNRDPRLSMSIYYPGAPWTIEFWGRIGGRFEENWILGGSGFKPKKWINDGKQMDRNNGEGNNKLFIRYAEVLLNYAEAKNEASGPDATVYAAIDELRNRVGMTTLSAAMPALSQSEMREVIRNERRIELVFEGHRLSDIRRWRIMEDVMVDALGYDPEYLGNMAYPGDGMGTTEDWQYVPRVIDFRSFNPQRDYLWPIPQSEINSNPNIDQNPFYN
ncbi:RagB/SusD family nutrient uptake outer membrane protein [uncultured Wocania sp.]|uniref:RagB/SusD family nutrient uptake outer membrane protein n=1 Tax=uncultured Wocania sp. TaxID=2834404 RepID=UPI0030F6F62E